jgi:hypothetical protein
MAKLLAALKQSGVGINGSGRERRGGKEAEEDSGSLRLHTLRQGEE